MATPKPQIRSTFATPICVHFLPVAQEANPILRPMVVEKMHAAGNGPSRGQGWRSPNDLESWGGAQVQTLFRVVRELADGATAPRGGARVSLNWQITACAAVRQKGEFAEMRARQGE